MPEHRANIRWKNYGPDFLRRQYSREHLWLFDGGAVVTASSSPHIVPAPWSNPASVDPEEAFVASVASCHMLWFLHVAIDGGFLAESYDDEAGGVMTENERGVLWMSEITLRPRVAWHGTKIPLAGEVAHLHDLAHERCVIANSIKTRVIIKQSGS